MYYAYDTPQGKKAIVDHTNDARRGFHTHAGQPKPSQDKYNVDFKDPEVRYEAIKIDGEHHIRYKE